MSTIVASTQMASFGKVMNKVKFLVCGAESNARQELGLSGPSSSLQLSICLQAVHPET